MKLMSEQAMVDFLPPEPEMLELAIAKFQKVIDAGKISSNWLRFAVAEGFLQVKQVNFQGQPAFMVWFNVGPEKRLMIDTVQSLQDRPQTEWIFEGVDLLARNLGCTIIDFQTRRRGLVLQAQSHGYEVTRVMLSKFLR